MPHQPTLTRGLVASLFGSACLLAAPVLAQTQIETLEARIAALEAEQAVAPSQTGFAFNTVDSLGDFDQIGQRHGLGRLSFGIADTTTLTIYGFIRAEAFYDFDFAQGDLSRAGRVGDPTFEVDDSEFDTSVRVSRFGIRSNTDTSFGSVATQLEFDLFGSGGDQSQSPNLRLRHANLRVTSGNSEVLLGQFWTNFMPLVHYPTTADFNGPVGITFARVPQARYTYRNNGLELSASLEESAGGDNSSDPVFTAAAFYGTDLFSVRAAVLTGTFEQGGDEFDTNGITLSGSVNPWEGGSVGLTLTAGEGLGNLLIGGGARQVGGAENESESLTFEFRQDISDALSAGIAYGLEDYDLATTGGLPGGFDRLESVHVNAFYSPIDALTYGVEYIHIESEGPLDSAEADRIGVSATLRF
ncbi:DcaP family trimeric outer membrane transporter [Gymnodinialimonas ulvae]|uniref:DcaP family trimeric outer membrane transporter n=1 Tax=Gymnodinialimonas ulvae TaxID=3126504 RepID=UPI0030984797